MKFGKCRQQAPFMHALRLLAERAQSTRVAVKTGTLWRAASSRLSKRYLQLLPVRIPKSRKVRAPNGLTDVSAKEASFWPIDSLHTAVCSPRESSRTPLCPCDA
jgi:hypothetical protein